MNSSLLDEEVKNMISQLLSSEDNETIKNIKKKISDYLFKKYCKKKSYLDECEPGYCVFRYTKTCDYVKALYEIQDTYNIKIIG